MPLSGSRTYVGFGFGAIQAGLFLYEAYRSGNFGRLVVCEVDVEVVRQLREADGFYSVNIAHADRIEVCTIGPVEVHNPRVTSDRERLVEAIANGHEIGTAIPSVDLYKTSGSASLHRVLADGLVRKAGQGGPPAVVYAAENHNRAAEILEELVLEQIPPELRSKVRSTVAFLNTVIGKMSGLVADAQTNGLATVTPNGSRAFLVESFNRILISRARLAQEFKRGITVFEEKDDLLPFEEAKLFGHNATHALAGYLGKMMGVRTIADLRLVDGFLPFLRDAFLLESGRALIREHAGVDRLFTTEGYAEYADDLLTRMTNPLLNDTVERVVRDPERKLGWDDRLIGTMRLARLVGVDPRRYAVGAAAGFAALDGRFIEAGVSSAEVAEPLWRSAHPEPADYEAMVDLVDQGRVFLHKWRDSGWGSLQGLFEAVYSA